MKELCLSMRDRAFPGHQARKRGNETPQNSWEMYFLSGLHEAASLWLWPSSHSAPHAAAAAILGVTLNKCLWHMGHAVGRHRGPLPRGLDTGLGRQSKAPQSYLLTASCLMALPHSCQGQLLALSCLLLKRGVT